MDDSTEPVPSLRAKTKAQVELYLLELCYVYEYRFGPGTRRKVFPQLLECILSPDRLQRWMAPQGHEGSETNPQWSEPNALSSFLRAFMIPPEYSSSARGTICGHIFKPGEPTYHCKLCGKDDTCVFCMRCFHSTNHEGHETYMSINSGEGSCCDCGDEEAWNGTVACKIHTQGQQDDDSEAQTSTDTMGEGNAADYGGPLTCEEAEVATAAIETMLELVSITLENMPDTTRETLSLSWTMDDEAFSRHAAVHTLPGDEPFKDRICKHWCVVLWNDEKHTFLQVIDLITRVTGRSREFGKVVASSVDRRGRETILTTTSLVSAIDAAESIASSGLSVTVRSARDVFREELCSCILMLLSDLVACPFPPMPSFFKDIISGALMSRMQANDGHDYELPIYMLQDSDGEDDSSDAFELINEALGATVDADITADGDLEFIVEAAQADAQRLAFDQVQGPIPTETGNTPTANEPRVASTNETETQLDIHLHRPEPGPQASNMTAEPWFIVHNSIQSPGQESDGPLRTDFPDDSGPHSLDFRFPEAQSNIWKLKGDSKPLKIGSCDNVLSRHPLLLIDYLLVSELKLPKMVRNALRQAYTQIMTGNQEFRRCFAFRFALLYTHLSKLYFFHDREPEYSIMNISIQILTVPSISTDLISRLDFFTSLNRILFSFFTQQNDLGHIPDNLFEAPVDFESPKIKVKRLFSVLHDIHNILQFDTVRKVVAEDTRHLIQFADLLVLFQGMHPIERERLDHVEYESDSWVSAFGISVPIARLIDQYGRCYENLNDQHRISAVKLCVRSLLICLSGQLVNSEPPHASNWHHFEPSQSLLLKRDYERYFRLVPFLVGQQPISFHHPLHWMLSSVLTYLDFTDRKRALKYFQCDPTSDYEQCGLESVLMAIIDHPLRVQVLMAQISARLWVRNGAVLVLQAHYYKEEKHREYFHDKDLHLISKLAAIMPPDDFLFALISRFDLLNIMEYDFGKPWKDYTLSHQNMMLESMLGLLLHILTERSLFLQLTELDQICLEIIHILCLKPLSYSEISQQCAARYSSSKDFDNALSLVSNYRDPTGLYDSGMYELKESALERINVYSLRYSRSGWDEAESALREKLAKNKGCDAKSVLIMPPITFVPEVGSKKDIMHPICVSSAFTRLILTSITYCLEYVQTNGKFGTLTGEETPRPESVLDLSLTLLLYALQIDHLSSHDGQYTFGTIILLDNHVASIFEMFKLTCYQSAWPKALAIIEQYCSMRNEDIESLGRRLGADIESDVLKKQLMKFGLDSMHVAQEERRRQANERQKQIMEDFKRQQTLFMNNYDVDFSDSDEDRASDLMEEDDDNDTANQLGFPSGNCIICQGECDESQAYGSLGLIDASYFLERPSCPSRELVEEILESGTDFNKAFGNSEVLCSPNDQIYPMSAKKNSSRTKSTTVRGCGHIMHFTCYEQLNANTISRINSQPYRNSPENVHNHEVLCPLCKSLSNLLVPIMWRPVKRQHLGEAGEAIADQIHSEIWIKEDQSETVFIKPLSKKKLYVNFFETQLQAIYNSQNNEADQDPINFGHIGSVREELTSMQQSIVSMFGGLERAMNLNTDVNESVRLLFGKWVPPSEDYVFAGSLIVMLANSIKTVEAASRKRSTNAIWSLGVSEQQSMLLRTSVYCVMGYMAYMSSQSRTNMRVLEDIFRVCYGRLDPEKNLKDPHLDLRGSTLRYSDRLSVFIALDLLGPNITGSQKHYLEQVYYWEIVYSVLYYCSAGSDICVTESEVTFDEDLASADLLDFQRFVARILSATQGGNRVDPSRILGNEGTLRQLYACVRTSVNVLLRQLTFYLTICNFELSDSADMGSEADSLAHALHLPTISQVISSNARLSTQKLASMAETVNPFYEGTVYMDYPSLYRLVKLPKRLDAMLNASFEQTCPNCHTVPQEPAICLVCGALLCFQLYCCTSHGVGECNLHATACGRGEGIFLLLRRSSVFLLHDGKGHFLPSPYLDAHGESLELRRFHPQFLSTRRYNTYFQQPWLDRSIADTVARNLDLRVDRGGWTTM